MKLNRPKRLPEHRLARDLGHEQADTHALMASSRHEKIALEQVGTSTLMKLNRHEKLPEHRLARNLVPEQAETHALMASSRYERLP